MSNAFSNICFTDSVKAAQSRYGSRERNQDYEQMNDISSELEERELRFIESRDSFYQATVSESGWPYVQHRGGPLGFLRVLDTGTIGYADFIGNRQYISVGNLNFNNCISLILMDYPNRRRLKVWGKTHIIHRENEPELIARLEVPGYRARVERGILIKVEAYEWNCPQHITRRYTEAELEHILKPLVDENKRLRDLIQQKT
jgi:hypothetical protein